MKSRAIGLGLFWVAVVYMTLMGYIASFPLRNAYRFSTFAEVSETIWAVTRPLFALWASAIPIGAILTGTGVLIYAGAKRSHTWLFGLGVFGVLLLDMLSRWGILPEYGHAPLLFGLVGGVICACYLGILWYWSRRYLSLREGEKTAAELQLAGYTFLLIAMWFLCGELSRPYMLALADMPEGSPVSIIVYLLLGWVFLALSHYQTAEKAAYKKARLRGKPVK